MRELTHSPENAGAVGAIARHRETPAWQVSAYVAACIVFLLANSAFSATPVLFSAYLDERHFTLSVAGAVAAAESTGLALGSALSVRVIRGARIDLRSIVTTVLGVLLVVQLLSAHVQAALPFGAVRLLSGVCVGMVQSAGSAWISQFKNSERLFAIYIGMSFLSGSVGLPFFAFTLRHVGLSGSFVIFAVLMGLAMLVAIAYPRRLGVGASPEANDESAPPSEGRRYRLALLLISVVINFGFNGGLWTFLDQLGQRAAIESARTSLILSAGMLTALGITAAVGVVGDRLGRLGPLAFAHLALIASSLTLLSRSSFAAAVIVFHIGLALVGPFYFASLAAIKPSQHSVLCGVAAMNIGFSIGPWVLAVLVDHAGYSALLTAAAALFAVSLLLVLMAKEPERVPFVTSHQ